MLYHDFEAAHSALQEEADTEKNVAACREIAARIVKFPAESIDEMLLKIRIALRCAGALLSGETLASIDGWKAGEPSDHRPDYEPEQFDCLCSLRDDLLRLGATDSGALRTAPEPNTTNRRRDSTMDPEAPS